jgi:hypothetical protein
MKPYLFEAVEVRSFHHPVFAGIQKHQFLIQASKLPRGLPTGANARDPVGMNRRAYRDVEESLKGVEAIPGSFDLMNLGITIIADRVELVNKERSLFNVFIEDEDGIVNGAHTALIIESQDAGQIPDEQHVEVRIITGIDAAGRANLKPDIAKGQNTGIAVKNESIYDKEGRFDTLKAIVDTQPWADTVAWRESDKGDFTVRDLICVLDALNVVDFSNESGTHPVHSYEKQSRALENFANDYKKHAGDLSRRTFAALEPLLVDALVLFDRVRHDFRPVFNQHVSPAAGRLRIIEEAPAGKTYKFPFSGQEPARYRLTKGAAFPIFAAFRNCVEYDAITNTARWLGGFDAVLELWEQAAPELVRETFSATKDIGHLPDQLGKTRGHWSNLHKTMALRALRLQLASQKS